MSKPKPSNAGGARQPVARTRRDQPQAPRSPQQGRGQAGGPPRHPSDAFTTRKPRPPAGRSPAASAEGRDSRPPRPGAKPFAAPGSRPPADSRAPRGDGFSPRQDSRSPDGSRPPRSGKPFDSRRDGAPGGHSPDGSRPPRSGKPFEPRRDGVPTGHSPDGARPPRSGKPFDSRRDGAPGGHSPDGSRPPRSGKPFDPRRDGAPTGHSPDGSRPPRSGKPFDSRRDGAPGGHSPDGSRPPRSGKPFDSRRDGAPGGHSPDGSRPPRSGKPFGTRGGPTPPAQRRDAAAHQVKPRTVRPLSEEDASTARAPARSPRPAAGGKLYFTPSSRPAKVPRARKMAQRHGSLKEEKISRELRDKRVDTKYMPDMRLQKALALTGIGSRRDMEEQIAAGLVEVNGKVAELGCKIGPDDKVRIQGRQIFIKWPDRLPRIIIYHKQEGEIVTRDDPEGRVTIFDRLPQTRSSKWVAVGRLDVNTSGLMIVTTSGELANRMMHPSFEVEREYAVRTLGELTPEQMQQATRGVALDDGEAHFQHISEQGGEGANRWYRVVLKEGRNREVRRLFEFFGLTVSRLIRVRFGSLHLPARLKRGKFHELDEVEVAQVMKWAGLSLTGQQKD